MTPLHGYSLIAGSLSNGNAGSFQAVSPIDLATLPGEFNTATDAEVHLAMEAAHHAFQSFRNSDGETRAKLLETIADEIEALGADLIERARLESGLPEARLLGERGRTCGQLRMFAAQARSNGWLDARIETAMPDRAPIPKPDLRRQLAPIGPVVVFGASNFPLAFSIAGGDTASALATGNPVVTKAHEAHPGTSELVAGAIVKALAAVNLPAGIFSMLQGSGRVIGIPLVKHPRARAVGFTGSLAAGRALFDAAASRPDPIPVFAEMGSLNPIIVLSSALNAKAGEIAGQIAGSVTQGVGQFCTKPGLILIDDCDGAATFRSALAKAIEATAPGTMLHQGISQSYQRGCATIDGHPAVTIVARAAAPAEGCQGAALVVEAAAADVLADHTLREELFGPFALLVGIGGPGEAGDLLAAVGGQLTATVFADPADPALPSLFDTLGQSAGRVILNGVPTGVEVCASMQHGGPWPASTDSRFTAVGSAALQRFVRPISYQNLPDALLPPSLQNGNPLGIQRLVNGASTSAAVGG
jgi:NADP-dependent aldehyde dehydrogenase